MIKQGMREMRIHFPKAVFKSWDGRDCIRVSQSWFAELVLHAMVILLYKLSVALLVAHC